VYIDTNVLVYHLKTTYKPNLTFKASAFLRRVETGQYEGVLATFVLLELVKAIRKVTVEFEHKLDPSIWKTDAEAAVKWAYKIPNVKFIDGTQEVGRVLIGQPLLEDALATFQRFPGSFKYDGSLRPVHDGLYPFDAIHLELARKAACSYIATFDHEFEESRGYVPVLNLNLGV